MPQTTADLAPSMSTDDLITTHMPLVGHIVRETMGRVPAHVSRDDLTSAGMLALVTAARAFDPTRGEIGRAHV